MGKRIPLLIFAFVVLLFALRPPAPAFCEGKKVYGRVLKDEALLYKNDTLAEEDVYFNLPYSYYVVILSHDSEKGYYQVEYQDFADGYSKIIGYVKEDDLVIWEDPTEPIYPIIPATADASGHMYSRPDNSSQKLLLISHDQKLKVYGSYYSEKDDLVYYYVIFSSQYAGYVPATILDIVNPGLHPDPIPTPPPTQPPQTPSPSAFPGGGNDEEPGQGDDSLLQIILIAAICVPALIVVYLMFKPSRRKYNIRYYDEDDVE